MPTIAGKFELVASLSFLDPGAGGRQVQLVMRNTPPGGDFGERSVAATAYLIEVVGASDGDSITVTGDAVNRRVFVVDSAQRA